MVTSSSPKVTYGRPMMTGSSSTVTSISPLVTSSNSTVTAGSELETGSSPTVISNSPTVTDSSTLETGGIPLMTFSELENMVDFLSTVRKRHIGTQAGHLLVIISSAAKKSANPAEDLEHLLNESNLAAKYFNSVDGTTSLRLFDKEMSFFPQTGLYWKTGGRDLDATSYRQASAAVRKSYAGYDWALQMAATYFSREKSD